MNSPSTPSSKRSSVNRRRLQDSRVNRVPKITEKHTLFLSEKRFQSIIENSSDGFRLIDKSGKIIYASPSTTRILGYSMEEYVNKKIVSLIHPDDKEKYQASVHKALTHPGRVYSLSYRIRHKNGTYRWMEGVGVNLLHDPHVRAVVSNFRDITERIDMERKKDEFISMASHELKTPLTTLNLFADLLKKNIKEKKYDNLSHIADKMRQQSTKLTEIVNDFLDVSRIETGKLRFRLQEFDINDLLSDIVEDMSLTASKHQVVFQKKSPVYVKADKYRIYQVLTNLLTNAVKYSPINTRITVATRVLKDSVQVRVKDEGIGIAKSQQKRIFEKLFQVGDKKDNSLPGLGMGLYISKEIIEQHNGRMWVKSQTIEESKNKKSGSTFYFTLPYIQTRK